MSLIKCPECQGVVSDKADSCPHCGYKILSTDAAKNTQHKMRIKVALTIAICVIGVIIVVAGINIYKYFHNKATEEKLQAYLEEIRLEEQEREAAQATIEAGIFDDLVITDINGYNNDKITAKLINNSSYTIMYVKVEFIFKKHDEIVDTDWTYAVSSEGLAPGETTEFYIYNENWAKNITATVIDFDYE